MDHLVFHVKPPQLLADPVQTMLCILLSRDVHHAASCCSIEIALASRDLVMEALAIILDEGERADLKTTVRY